MDICTSSFGFRSCDNNNNKKVNFIIPFGKIVASITAQPICNYSQGFLEKRSLWAFPRIVTSRKWTTNDRSSTSVPFGSSNTQARGLQKPFNFIFKNLGHPDHMKEKSYYDVSDKSKPISVSFIIFSLPQARSCIGTKSTKAP